MRITQRTSNNLTELEQQIQELMNDEESDSHQLNELRTQVHWLKNKLKVYFSLRAAFDALPENGAGEAYGNLLDQMEDVKAVIRRRVSTLKMVQQQQESILVNINSPTERV